MPRNPGTLPFVLMYHSISRHSDDPHQITVSPARFRRQMDWLNRRGLRGVSMRELLRAVDQGSSAGLVGLTFDDGYADFAIQAVPVLREYGFTATNFVVAGKLGGSNDWDHGPVKALMTAEQVCQMAQLGMEIGSHGFGHRDLTHADADRVVELRHSRDILQSLLDEAVPGFSYPYGEVSAPVARAAQTAGYAYAVATSQAASRDRYALPRTYVGQRDGVSRLYAKQIRHRLKWVRQ
jgi:peptidoglycan/xylan/chitin deacetylase (PgdA/CDA1 family)